MVLVELLKWVSLVQFSREGPELTHFTCDLACVGVSCSLGLTRVWISLDEDLDREASFCLHYYSGAPS